MALLIKLLILLKLPKFPELTLKFFSASIFFQQWVYFDLIDLENLETDFQ